MNLPVILPLPLGGSQKKGYPYNHLISLLDGFIDFSVLEKYNLIFKGLSLNSKNVHEDFLFFACASIHNKTHHGIAYAGEAINLGASCILWEPTQELHEMPISCSVEGREIPLIPVKNLHQKAGEIAARFYQKPSQTLNVVGITGTNGKTSIAHCIAQLQTTIKTQNLSLKKCAVIGTLGNGLYGQLESSQYTTPDAVTLHALMAQYKKEHADTLIMEVSSHALSQGRVNGVAFDTAIFTNLTRDHLDYHKTMQLYGEEKLKLFQMPSLKQVVINVDDEFSGFINASIEHHSKRDKGFNVPKIIRYSKKDNKADYFAKDCCLNHEGTSFILCANGKEYKLTSPLVGDFNIDNLLATIAVLELQGHALETIIDTIHTLTNISGRMEMIKVETSTPLALIVVDFAHTPDALEKTLNALKPYVKGKLYCIFGCGGDRDKGKRPLMAKVVEKIADIIMVTSDNPRYESEQDIISDIVNGFDNKNKIFIEYDREKAIQHILEQLSCDDVLLIAGKGHEDYQEIKGQRLPFSDKDVVLSFYKSHHDRQTL